MSFYQNLVVNIGEVRNSNLFNEVVESVPFRRSATLLDEEDYISKRQKIDGSIKSFDDVKLPTPDFLPTAEYFACKSIAENNKVLILHIHGYPGTGKSEIAKKLAEDIDGFNNDICAKYHIECDDNNQDLETELIEFMKRLKENKIISQEIKSALKSLKKNRPKPYVDLLQKSAVPILIIIEDPKENSTLLLREFLLYVAKVKNSTALLHIYITSRKNAIAMPANQLSKLKSYKPFNVEGFTEEEALQYLFEDRFISKDEKEAAVKIVKQQSGSPLGLLAVKADCRKSRLSYQAYLKHSEHEKLEHGTYKREVKHLQEEYGPHAQHLFQSLTLFLRPRDYKDVTAVLIWNVMTCLAFFHHGNVPQVLVAKVTQMFRENSHDNTVEFHCNEAESGEFITNLVDCGIGKVDKSKNPDFKKETISFHEVVFRAVRLKLKADTEANLYELRLKRAVYSLSGISHKDLRKTEDNIFMNKISSHIQSVLYHSKSALSLDPNSTFEKEDFIFWMCICHLYEVLGIVKSLGVLSLKELSENCLKDATQVLIKAMNSLTNNNMHLDILDSQRDCNLEEVASTIWQHCLQAGKKLNSSLPPGTIDAYISLVLQMKPDELKYLESRADNKEAIFEVKSRAEMCLTLDVEVMQKLRNSGTIFLDQPSHNLMFFVERLSSILHTWGRVLLYYNTQITPEMRDHYKWFSMLSRAISVECKKSINLRTLFEHLTSISIVPIMLKGLGKSKERKAVLLEAKSILQNMLDQSENTGESQEYYEHGHVKKTGAEYDAIFLRRFMVRINARLVGLIDSDKEDFITKADEVCHTLHTLSVENIDWIMAPKCIVYCGKYYAAKQEYEKAADCFLEALKAGIDQSMNLHAWACYNYARATASGRVKLHASEVSNRCKELLKNTVDVDNDLVLKVTEQYNTVCAQLLD